MNELILANAERFTENRRWISAIRYHKWTGQPVPVKEIEEEVDENEKENQPVS